MVRVTAQKRTVLGGAAHGQSVRVLHGSTMVWASSGDTYRRYLDKWWVPSLESDDEAAARVRNFRSK